jgi:hypothetical protein
MLSNSFSSPLMLQRNKLECFSGANLMLANNVWGFLLKLDLEMRPTGKAVALLANIWQDWSVFHRSYLKGVLLKHSSFILFNGDKYYFSACVREEKEKEQQSTLLISVFITILVKRYYSFIINKFVFLNLQNNFYLSSKIVNNITKLKIERGKILLRASIHKTSYD